MVDPARGEVWLIDLGIIGKVRPALIVSVPYDDQDRALITIVPHTTSLRGSRFEVLVSTGYLKPGAFDTQNLVTISNSKFIRKLGQLDDNQFAPVMNSLRSWLGIP